jgi:hypothetical protein
MKVTKQQLKDYAEYVEAKIDIEEMPFTLQQWLDIEGVSND